jgi:osmotically-inducible protein OsmY
MKSIGFGTASALCLVCLLAGCANTLNGVHQDATHDAQAVSTTAANAGAIVKQTAADAKAASVLTPAIKLAIIRDPVLNNPANHINVNVDASAVHLSGHIQSADMQQRATEDAQVVLTAHHATQTLSNQLTIAGS